jgi:DNA-binding MarR family transcriptional regulator
MSGEAGRGDIPRREGGATEAEADMRLESQLCFAFYTANHMIVRLYRAQLEPLGLTFPQLLVLMVLWERAPCTLGDIGDAIELDSGTLTPLVKRMEANGFVTRRRDPYDERRVIVELTSAGRAFREQAVEIRRNALRVLGLEKGGAAELRAALQTVAARAKQAIS